MRRFLALFVGLVIAGAVLSAGGCVLAPGETGAERGRLEQAGRDYARGVSERTLPELPTPADWRDLLHRAFLANGDLEASWHEWNAAMARINMAAAWPNSNLSLGYEYMFSKEKMKAWDRTTLSAGFDPAMSLQAPIKARGGGKVALAEAQAAGQRFRAAKFTLQKQVLTAYLELAMTEQKVRIQRDNVELLRLLVQTAGNRVQAGGPQQDLLKSQIAHRLAENDLANMESEARVMRAMLNGMLGRDPQAVLTLGSGLPTPRPLAADDGRLIAVAVDQNPDLAALAAQVRGRNDALELAKLRYLPDINPMGAITGDMSKMLGAMVMVPTNLPMIRGAVNEARAMLRASEAMARQTRSDRAAGFVAGLLALRNTERQVALYEQRILPAVEQALGSSRQAYATGTVGFADLIDSQRTALEVRLMIVEARIEREKRLAELEALAGTDIETLGAPTSAPASAQTPTTSIQQPITNNKQPTTNNVTTP